MPGWVVVKFSKENVVEVVPYKWIETQNGCDTCLWPMYNKKSEIVDAIINKATPMSNWKLCTDVEKCSSKIYTSFEEANRKASKAKYTSDISASEEIVRKKRIVKKPSRFECGSTTSSEDSLLDFPVPPENQCFQITEETPVIIEDMGEDSRFVDINPIIETRNETTSSLASTSIQAQSNSQTDVKMPNRPTLMQSQEDFQKQCLRELAILNVRMRDLTDFIHAHIGQIHISDFVEESPTDVFKDLIPIKNNEILSNVEELLQTDNCIEKLVKRVSNIGGNNLKDVIRRILAALIADEVVVGFSMVGEKGKQKFGLLRLNQVVFGAVRRSPLSKNSTDKEIELIIAVWLSKATERLKRNKGK